MKWTMPSWSKNGETTTKSDLVPNSTLVPAVRRLMSLCLCLCLLCYGFGEEVTMRFSLFLWDGIHVSTHVGANGALVKMLARAVASIVYGFAVHRLNRSIALLMACLTCGTAYFATPLIHGSAWQYFVASGVSGASHAVIQVSCLAWILEMYGKHSARVTPLLVMATIMGQVVGAFVPIPALGNEHASLVTQSRFAHKFAATAMFFATATLAMLYGTRKYQQVNRKFKDPKEGSEDDVVKVVAADGSIQLQAHVNKHWHKVLFVGLGIAVAALAESSHINRFLPYYGGSSMISQMSMIMLVSGVVSCVVLAACAALTMKVPVAYFTPAATIVFFVGNMVLLFASATTPVSGAMMWAGAILANAGHAVIIPFVLSLMELKVNVTDAIVGIIVAVQQIVLLVTLALVSFQEVNGEKRTFLYYNFGVIASIASLLVMIVIMGKRIK